MKHTPDGPRCNTCIIGGRAGWCNVPPGLGFMQEDGAMQSGVLVVAESLGHHEAVQGKALVGNAGWFMGRSFMRKRLEHTIQDGAAIQERLGGWHRDEFAYTNVLRCQPQGGSKTDYNKIRDPRGHLLPWAEEAIEHCRPYLDETINRREPGCILAFGDTAFHTLTGRTDLRVLGVRGYAFRDWRNRTWVVPTPHPAFLLRGNTYLQPAMLWDMDKARWIAEQGYDYEQFECIADPSVEVWDRYVSDMLAYLAHSDRPVVALDIETPFKQGKGEGDLVSDDDPSFTILDISFCFEGRRGMTVAWRMPYLPGIERVFRALADHPRATSIIWNRPYDRPRIRHNLGEWALPIHTTEDAMDAWHVLYNTMDRNIGFATACYPLGQRRIQAWKHLGQDDPLYRVMDSVALWRNYQDISTLLDATGQRDVYEMMVHQLDPSLERASANGLLIDLEMREQVSAELLQRLRGIRNTMTAAISDDLVPTKVWKTAKAAEKGLELLKQRDEVDQAAALFEVPGRATVTVCERCGQPAKKPHVTRKFAKEEKADAHTALC